MCTSKNETDDRLIFIRSSFVVYDRQYLEHNKNEKQSECLFPLFEVHITLGFKSEVSAFILNLVDYNLFC
jgi:hypothetical protein